MSVFLYIEYKKEMYKMTLCDQEILSRLLSNPIWVYGDFISGFYGWPIEKALDYRPTQTYIPELCPEVFE